jgi:hypothetical protein
MIAWLGSGPINLGAVKRTLVTGPAATILWMTTSCSTACMKSSDASAKSFMQVAYSTSHKGEKSVLIMKDTLWKNNLNFVKDVPMIYVNFIRTVVVASDKKKIGDIILVCPLYHGNSSVEC